MRIMVADDQPKVRFALRVLLERQAGLEITGEVADAKNLFAQALAIRPDLVLVSWELPELALMGSLPALRKICPPLFFIALSGRTEARRAALQAGADAFVSKTDLPEQLLTAVDRIATIVKRNSQDRERLQGAKNNRVAEQPSFVVWSSLVKWPGLLSLGAVSKQPL